jgi:hypothetical protein
VVRKSFSSLPGAAANPAGIALAQSPFNTIPISPIPPISPISPIPPTKLPYFGLTRSQLGTAKVWPLLLQMVLFALLAWPAAAQQPVISHIEFYSTDQVLIHFDVQANTTCTLQYTSNLATNGVSGTGIVPTNAVSVTWSNLYAAPNLPFFEHYIIVDTRTNRQRFYRLVVTP